MSQGFDDDVITGRIAAGLLEAADHAMTALDVGASRTRLLEIEAAIDEINLVLDIVDETCQVELEGDEQ